MKFVSFRMTAEVIVILENEYSGGFSGSLAEKMSRGEAADSRADNHQVIGLFCVDRRRCCFPERPVPQAMRRLEGTRMTSSEAGSLGRAEACVGARRLGGKSHSRKQAATDNHGGTVQKIAAADWPIH